MDILAFPDENYIMHKCRDMLLAAKNILFQLSNSSMITEQQVNYFDTFGYLALPGLFSDEITAITDAFNAVFADESQMRWEAKSDKIVTGRREVVPGIIERHADLSKIITDRRVLDIANALMPTGYTFLPGDGSRFRSETCWHADVTGIDLNVRNIKMALYLDPLDTDNGALRVLPGTHRIDNEFTKQVSRMIMPEGSVVDKLGIKGSEIPSWTLKSNPGDLLVWDRRVLHSSYKGTKERRVIAFGFKAAA